MMSSTMDAGAAAQIYSNMSPTGMSKAVKNMTDGQIKQAATEFESMFIGMM